MAGALHVIVMAMGCPAGGAGDSTAARIAGLAESEER